MNKKKLHENMMDNIGKSLKSVLDLDDRTLLKSSRTPKRPSITKENYPHINEASQREQIQFVSTQSQHTLLPPRPSAMSILRRKKAPATMVSLWTTNMHPSTKSTVVRSVAATRR